MKVRCRDRVTRSEGRSRKEDKVKNDDMRHSTKGIHREIRIYKK